MLFVVKIPSLNPLSSQLRALSSLYGHHHLWHKWNWSAFTSLSFPHRSFTLKNRLFESKQYSWVMIGSRLSNEWIYSRCVYDCTVYGRGAAYDKINLTELSLMKALDFCLRVWFGLVCVVQFIRLISLYKWKLSCDFKIWRIGNW